MSQTRDRHTNPRIGWVEAVTELKVPIAWKILKSLGAA